MRDLDVLRAEIDKKFVGRRAFASSRRLREPSLLEKRIPFARNYVKEKMKST